MTIDKLILMPLDPLAGAQKPEQHVIDKLSFYQQTRLSLNIPYEGPQLPAFYIGLLSTADKKPVAEFSTILQYADRVRTLELMTMYKEQIVEIVQKNGLLKDDVTLKIVAIPQQDELGRACNHDALHTSYIPGTSRKKLVNN